MAIRAELNGLNSDLDHLFERATELSAIDAQSIDDEFVAEAIAFKAFRLQERACQSFFLECCVSTRTPNNEPIKSKLRCSDRQTAEDILKAGNRFLEWGNPSSVRQLAQLIFRDGFPVSDIILTKNHAMTDLRKIRNYIAHDSSEAQKGFNQAARNYLAAGQEVPDTAGQLLLSRKRPADPIVLDLVLNELRELLNLFRQT